MDVFTPLTSLVTLFVSLSVAVERIIEILKGMIPPSQSSSMFFPSWQAVELRRLAMLMCLSRFPISKARVANYCGAILCAACWLPAVQRFGITY